MVAHLNLVMPRSRCMRTTSRSLLVFICGRSRSTPPAISIMRRMFDSTRSGYTSSAGEGRSATFSTRYQAMGEDYDSRRGLLRPESDQELDCVASLAVPRRGSGRPRAGRREGRLRPASAEARLFRARRAFPRGRHVVEEHVGALALRRQHIRPLVAVHVDDRDLGADAGVVVDDVRDELDLPAALAHQLEPGDHGRIVAIVLR